MDTFSKIIGSVGGVLGGGGSGGGGGNPLQSILSIAGLVNQFSLAQKEKALMDRSVYYAKHPEAVSNMVTAATKPLSSGLTTGVENVVNASLAEQGLSQAPGIQSQVLSQALAPYQQQEQQLALEQVLKTIGLPNEALTAIQSTMRPDSLALMLKSILPGSSPSPSGPLSSPSYMPSTPAGIYGPDVAAPDIGSIASSTSGIDIGSILGGGGGSNPTFSWDPTAGWGGS